MILIKSIQADENWEIIYTLENGEIRQFDVKPYLNFEAFQEINEISEFKKIHNGRYYIEWESGADLSLDTLNAKSVVIKERQLVA